MKKITLLSAILLLMVQLTFSQNISAKRIKINNPTKDQLLKVKVAGIDLACGAIFKDNSLILELGEGELDALNQQNIPYTIMVEDLIEYYKKKNEIELPIAKAELEAKKAKKLANKSLSTKSKSINNFIQYEGCTEVDWDVPTNFNLGSMMGCLTYSEMLAELDQMRALYPNLISVKTDASPGTVTHGNSYTNNGAYDTWAGQPIYYVRISDNPDTDEPNEPESLYSGMTHSREVSSMMNLIYYMWYILENYNTDTGIKNLVDNHEMYFIPVANPDGLMWNEQIAPSGGGYQRKNLGPYNTGNNNVRGVDLNRNYDYFWGSHSIYANGGVGSSGTQSSGTYRGPSAFSEPETQIVRNFSATREFKTAMNHHAQSNLIPHSYNGYPGAPSSGREAEYHKFCHDMTRFNRYIYGEAPDILTIANGDMSDWMLGGATDLNGSNGSGQGILALAPENGAHDGSEGTFWPSATQIVDIAQRAVRMNFVNAYHSGKFAQFHDLNSSDITATAGNLEFGLEYLGQTLGDITLSIAPITPNNNIRFTSSTFDLSNDAPYTSVQSSWNKLEQRTISVPYALKTSIVDNEKIEFEITVTNDDGYVMYRANIIKTFNPNVLFQDNPDTDNLTNWTASGGTWGTTTDAYSGTKAISYAPSGSYTNDQSNRRLTLNSTIDLSSSTASVIQFFAKWDLERNFDFAQIQGSTDGSTWIPLCGKYTKPGASEATNRYTSTYSSNTNTGKSTNDKNNQASAGLVYDADTMDKWVMEEIAIDATENSFLLGATNARFRFVFDSDSNNRADGYPTTFDGFSFDDFKVISIEIPCVTDVPTNVSASSITGTSATITWDNTPSATYDLRYKESTSGTWIDVLNISTTTHNLTGLNNSTNYDVQVRSKCVNNSNYSASTQFSTAVSYCSANGDDGTYFYIDNVSFGSIDNNSTGNTSGYSNFTSLSHNLIPTGSTETISISIHYTGTQYELATSVWIDFNQDGDFADSGEQVLSNPSSITSPITGNITIPNNALAGTTRMRIIQKYYGITGEFANDPCESFNYGEVEDYTINIKSNDPIASCQNIDATLDATGNVTITAANLDDGTSVGDLSIDISSFTCANIGTNNVTLTATDPSDSGNIDTCVAVVTVIQQDAPTQTNCWDNYTYNYTTCVWENQGTQPTEPTTELECWETRSFNDTTCAWEVTGTQPTEPTTELECWETRSFNDTTCAWEVTGTQPAEPTTELECWETRSFNDTTCAWEVTGTQPTEPTTELECWETRSFNDTTCAWEVTGTQPTEPTTELECWETRSFNDTTCAWEVTGTQPAEPTTELECWETRSFNDTTCAWEVTGTQPTEPTTELECWETRSFNDTTCAWEVTGTQPTEPTTELECWETRSFNDTTCAWEVTGTQPTEPTTELECWETRSFNDTTCAWEVTGTQPTEPTTELECWETRSFNDTTCAWEVTGTQPTEPTTELECWETRSFNDTTCAWEVTGTQPTEPTTELECWETRSFNDTTCAWEVTGTQPAEPTTELECWETRSFNDTTCAWEVTGTQPTEPTTELECWETRSFNDTTCAWEVTGTQPTEPTTELECWETRSFNDTTCAWEVTGTQPTEPTTELECWETRSFNDTTCAWEVTGTQPTEPTTELECWETRSFNDTTCAWEVTGTQPTEPTTELECWETRSFNDTTCAWEVTGTQPTEPTTELECWETRSFNDTTCAWEVTGTQPTEPTTELECWETRSFNDTTCAWEVTGTQPTEPTTELECWETRSFNDTTCAWEVTGTQPTEPTTELECWETRSFNDTTCAWEVTGTQPTEPTTELECWETRSFNDTTCAWEVTGTQPTEPTTELECWETRSFNDTTCAWEVTGTQPTEPTTELECWETRSFNDTTCAWEVTGTQPTEPTTELECWETRSFNDTTCAWEVTGTQPAEPTTELECWETRSFNDTTCAWEVTGTQPTEPTTQLECWETRSFNDTTCAWEVTGTQPAEPTTELECWETRSFNDTTCAWEVTGTQPTEPTTELECWETRSFNDTTCAWEVTGTQPAEPTTELECWETRSFNDTTCAWEVTGTQPTEPTTELECWETRSFNDTTCAWEVTGTQPAEPTTECYETATFNDTTCSWEVTDNGTGTLYYRDNDNDGFGDPSISVLDCSTPTGYVTNSTDCDDTDNTIYPGAPEITNDGIDQDCDGSDQTTLDTNILDINLIVVTPNPFKDNVNIQLPTSVNNSDFNIKVFDLNGRLVFDRKFSSKNSQVKVTGLSKLNQAPYIFKIINIKSGATTYKRMIKN